MIYKLIREKRKTISITIGQNGDIFVKAPKGCGLNIIDNFVKLKQNWINKHRNQIINNNQKYKDFYDLKKILLLGSVYEVKFDDKYINIGGSLIKRAKLDELSIKRYLTCEAEKYIINRTYEIANKLNLKFNAIKIISARKKWGSCNSGKELKFNYKLVMLNKYLIDYVICHELCHIVYMNHSSDFWGLLLKLGFDKKEIKKQMKNFSFVLNLF